VDQSVLKANQRLDLRVFAVWEQVLNGDGQAEPPNVLIDARVTHIFDEVAIGQWFGARDSTLHAGGGLAWDAFMLFDDEATFATLADHLEAHGRTIIADSNRLKTALT
jgi:hypothetical protein